jgi:Ca2+-dependent lipid-binding protein
MSDTALECIITLVEGKGLMVDNYTGHTDPHVIFKLGGNEYTSKTKTQTLNPTWNETFSFKGNFKDTDTLSFEVLDWDIFSVDGSFFYFFKTKQRNLEKVV